MAGLHNEGFECTVKHLPSHGNMLGPGVHFSVGWKAVTGESRLNESGESVRLSAEKVTRTRLGPCAFAKLGDGKRNRLAPNRILQSFFYET